MINSSHASLLTWPFEIQTFLLVHLSSILFFRRTRCVTHVTWTCWFGTTGNFTLQFTCFFHLVRRRWNVISASLMTSGRAILQSGSELDEWLELKVCYVENIHPYQETMHQFSVIILLMGSKIIQLQLEIKTRAAIFTYVLNQAELKSLTTASKGTL